MFGAKAVVGLDIGSQKVKAVQLRKKGNALELERFGVADIYPDGDRSAASGDPRQLKIQAVQRALNDGRITAKHCVSAVSGESIIVRYIQLPQMPEAELKNALRWEAEEYIPFHIDEVNLDSEILGTASQEGKVDVLLVAAKKDLVGDHLDIVRATGLTPLVVDVDSFAFLNCYEAIYKPTSQDCVALVNIGAQITNINIYVGGTSRFARDINVAGDAISAAIAQKTGVTFSKAEELKRALGAPMPDEREPTEEEESSLISSIRGTVQRMTGSDIDDEGLDSGTQKAIRNVLTNLMGEIRRSVQFFENQSGGATVQKLILGGGTSRMPNLAPYLSSELETPVEVFDPLRGLSLGGSANQALFQDIKEHLSVGIGLALRKAG
ncbi:MAG: type IV pilus assembly protein PilM [Candidatus Sumerlaeia bacterium]|nr:type IV pilus assembly protein PilM [Candidatus Sumerlaeia bacterium]